MRREISDFIEKHLSALRYLEKRMAMTFRGTLHVFAYKDAGEIQRITEADSATGAFATGSGLHVPLGLDPHHELAHYLCLTWNSSGNDPVVPEEHPVHRYEFPVDIFATEGLAGALSPVKIWGTSPREWAALYVRLGAKPDMSALVESFPKWPDAMNSYWMAGVALEFLIERFGIGKLKEWYHRRSADAEIFGQPLGAMNKAWVAWIKQAVADPARIARSVPDAVWFEKRITGFRGAARVTVAADEWWILFHNGREVGGGWQWWWPRSHEIELTGEDELRFLALNFGSPRLFVCECTRLDGREVIIGSDTSWTAHNLDGQQKEIAIIDGPAAWVPRIWPKEGIALVGKIRGKRIWTTPLPD